MSKKNEEGKVFSAKGKAHPSERAPHGPLVGSVNLFQFWGGGLFTYKWVTGKRRSTRRANDGL